MAEFWRLLTGGKKVGVCRVCVGTRNFIMSLTFMASERVVPGYGGGMSSAKAALESDTRVLAYEAGRRYGARAVRAITAARVFRVGSGRCRGRG